MSTMRRCGPLSFPRFTKAPPACQAWQGEHVGLQGKNDRTGTRTDVHQAQLLGAVAAHDVGSVVRHQALLVPDLEGTAWRHLDLLVPGGEVSQLEHQRGLL